MKKNASFGAVVALLLLMVVPVFSNGQSDSGNAFPEKSITVICPWSAGGGTDTILRALAKETEQYLGTNITVTNKTGGGGAVGHGAGLTVKPDGYTATMVTFELLSLPPQGLVPFTYEDYDLLLRVNMDPAAVTVPADAPYDTIEEFIAYAQANPGTINIGHSGPGSVWHIAGGIFAELADIDVKFIPYDGAAPAVTALAGRHIEAVTVSPAEVQGQVESGNLKILGIMSDERLAKFPEVPTLKERGLDVSFGTWRGIAVPKGTPEDVKLTLTEAFKKGMETPFFVDFAANGGYGLAYLPADEFRKDLEISSTNVSNVMKSLGLAK